MQNVKDHFEQEAKIFDELILKLIPYYPEMLEALILAIPFPKEEPIKVLDLGSGTGTIAKKIYENYPKAKITCLDLAENMIEFSKIKLKNYLQTEYVVSDFSQYIFKEQYDVVVSSLALHHLISDQDKQSIFKKIYTHLNQDGVFYNADIILGSNNYLHNVYLEKWKEFMKKNVAQEEVDSLWLAKHRDEDHPSKLMDQLKWLELMGFKDVDVIWKYYNFAVYGGKK